MDKRKYTGILGVKKIITLILLFSIFNFLFTLTSCSMLQGCNSAMMLTISNWVALAGALFIAFGGIGKYYFSEKIKKISILPNKQEKRIHDINFKEFKRWMIKKDSPIILEAIDIQLNYHFQVELKKGDKINIKKYLDWDIDGEKPFKKFSKDWKDGIISTENTTGILDISGKKFLVKDANKDMTYRNMSKCLVTYRIFKRFFLTNTNSLPNSSEIKNFHTKKTNRIFTEEDLAKFNIGDAKIYNSLEDIPEQSGNILHFRLKPTIRHSQ